MATLCRARIDARAMELAGQRYLRKGQGGLSRQVLLHTLMYSRTLYTKPLKYMLLTFIYHVRYLPHLSFMDHGLPVCVCRLHPSKVNEKQTEDRAWQSQRRQHGMVL